MSGPGSRRSRARIAPSVGVLLVFSCVVCWSPALAEVNENPRQYASWWVANYGATKLPAVQQEDIQAVYDRVAAVSNGRRGGLTIVEGPRGEAKAAAMRDRTIVLNRALIEACARFAGAARDDLLAFVIAHELAHLQYGDITGFASLGGAADGSLSREEQQGRELAADARGLLSTIEAGFDHHVAVDAAARGFLRSLDLGDQGSARQREDRLPGQLAKLAQRVEEYRLGVRLVQLGRLEDGRLLIGRLRELYEGREVLNDLAVATLRLASRTLARCDGKLVSRFRLPTLIDGDTLAGRARLRGAARSPCLDDRRFTDLVEQAIDLLEQAIKNDGEYLPAKLNLTYANLLAGRSAEAIGSAHAGFKQAPKDVDVLIAFAIATHSFGREIGSADSTDRALDLLDQADAQLPTAMAAWNRAAIEDEQGRAGAAEASWRRALQLEPSGEWADIARERLRMDPVSPPAPVAVAAIAPPIALGPLGGAHENLRSRSLDFGAFRGRVLSKGQPNTAGGNSLALVIRDSVELVQSPPPRGFTLGSIEAHLGSPQRSERTAHGILYSWPGLLAEVVDGKIANLVWWIPDAPKI